jgi:hypothetical protein
LIPTEDEDLGLPIIGVFWKNDLPDGFGFKTHGAPAEYMHEHIEKYLPDAMADLRAHPEAKNHLLGQLAWYAANRTQLSDEDSYVWAHLVALNVVALKKAGVIVTDEFNGVVRLGVTL